MDEQRDPIGEDLDSEEVHIRDKWQFELKSEFFPPKNSEQNQYTQEFYLFIPNSLQINPSTYTKAQFYLDQTCFVRYKTPRFTFEQLLDENTKRSPLMRIFEICKQSESKERQDELVDELKLLANVVRSTLRTQVKESVASLNKKNPREINSNILLFCSNILNLRNAMAKARKTLLESWKDPLIHRQLIYIEEFISSSISFYLAGLLQKVRYKANPQLHEADKALADILINEKQQMKKLTESESENSERLNEQPEETVLYRTGLLNKYVLDALMLATNRFSLDQKYQHWIGSFSAGLAMLLYFSLFVWLGSVFVINSEPFIILTVAIYVLKDRIKEWLRTLSYQHASRWFPDYTTVIRSLHPKRNLGLMKESFTFLEPKRISEDIKEARNVKFHTMLDTFERPENVIFYKRIIEINTPAKRETRRHGLNIILRYNIMHFLEKASDPVEMVLDIDPETRNLITRLLPKVYHLTLLIRNTITDNGSAPITEIKKLRIVVDKSGIKRIESLGTINSSNKTLN